MAGPTVLDAYDAALRAEAEAYRVYREARAARKAARAALEKLLRDSHWECSVELNETTVGQAPPTTPET